MIRTYDPNKVYVFAGPIPIGGFADGSSVKVIRSNDTFEKIEGIGGIISRSKTFNKSGEISFTLAQTSMSNDILSGLMLTDELSNSAIIPVTIYETGSKSLFVSAFAWIRRPTEVSFGKTLTDREWVFDAADIDIFVGGNVGQD
jgi:hypothetical protein